VKKIIFLAVGEIVVVVVKDSDQRLILIYNMVQKGKKTPGLAKGLVHQFLDIKQWNVIFFRNSKFCFYQGFIFINTALYECLLSL
jgi:hypothetical protein